MLGCNLEGGQSRLSHFPMARSAFGLVIGIL